MIVIYAVVFGIFLRVQPEYPGVSYGLYLCSVLIPWMAFSEAILKDPLQSFGAGSIFGS